jgi:phosphoribosylglycinamide formyltransferase-1
VGYKVVFVGSTGGGVFSKLVQHEFVKNITHEVVSDRECGFLEVASKNGVNNIKLETNDGHRFSDYLNERYRPLNNLIFLSFYTKLFRGRFLANKSGAIFNCHPSILPAFKGMSGFEDTIASSATFMGCTLHQVDEGIDTGRIVIQAAIPLDRQLPVSLNRHKIFLAQYYSTLQFLRWVSEDRLKIDISGQIFVEGCFYAPSVFSPNLDLDFFDFIGAVNELQ